MHRMSHVSYSEYNTVYPVQTVRTRLGLPNARTVAERRPGVEVS
jgi:hypothetical protein